MGSTQIVDSTGVSGCLAAECVEVGNVLCSWVVLIYAFDIMPNECAVSIQLEVVDGCRYVGINDS